MRENTKILDVLMDRGSEVIRHGIEFQAVVGGIEEFLAQLSDLLLCAVHLLSLYAARRECNTDFT